MTKSSPPKYPGRGLVNPLVTPRQQPASAKKPTRPHDYQTHIPEPRWQRIISLIVVACIVAFEIYFWIIRRT